MKPINERGSTLIIASMMLLVMLGLAVSMTFNAQSQANLTSGVKLQQFYETAALNAFNQARAVLPDYWQDIDVIDDASNDKNWRFGGLLQSAATKSDTSHGNFPAESELTYVMAMNGGNIDLTYKVWVSNNPDDPAHMMQGKFVSDFSGSIDTNWDLDGRIVLKVEVFSPLDSVNPVITQSAVLSPIGGEFAHIHDDALIEGDATDVGFQGTGTKGTAARIEIASLEDEDD